MLHTISPAKGKIKRAKINKNFCNYQLACDARHKSQWRKSAKTGRWLSNLTPEILFILLADVDETLKRFPTAFDMSVLFTLLRQSDISGEGTIEYASLGAILKAMGFDASKAYLYRALKQALDLWLHLNIRFDCWNDTDRSKVAKVPGFIAGKKYHKVKLNKKTVHKSKGKGRHDLPPPIASLEHAQTLKITISDEWRELSKGFYAMVPLPLPNKASVQNLVLKIRAWSDQSIAEADAGVDRLVTMSVTTLAKMTRINNINRIKRINRTIDDATAWFEGHGFTLTVSHEQSNFTFNLSPLTAAPRPVAPEHVRVERVRFKKKHKIEMHLDPYPLMPEMLKGFKDERGREYDDRLWKVENQLLNDDDCARWIVAKGLQEHVLGNHPLWGLVQQQLEQAV